MQTLLKKKLFKAILLTLPILIVLQDVSYALSPTSRFRPITDLKEQLSQPPAAPAQVGTVSPIASDVLKPQKDNEPVPISPAAPAHVETMKLAMELKDIKKGLREKLFAMKEAREALVKILDEMIKEGLFPGGFVIRESSKNTAKGALIKKLRSELTRANNPEDQEAIIAKVNFTMGAVKRIISKMQNKVKDDEMKDILGMQRRYDEIRNELVKESKGLVWMVVNDCLDKLGKKREEANDLSDDLFQIGNIGLISAIESFDPDQGFEFSTYAVTAINRAIEKMLKQRLVEIPQHLWKEKSEIDKFIAKFTQAEKRNPTVEEVAAGLNLPVSRVEKILRAFKKPVSLENPFDEEDEESPLSRLEYPSGRNMEPPSEDALIIKEKLGQVLSDKEKMVITLRYGLDGKGERPLREIGKILKISHERVSQIESNALKKLRSHLQPKGSNPPFRKDTNRQVKPAASLAGNAPIEVSGSLKSAEENEPVPISPQEEEKRLAAQGALDYLLRYIAAIKAEDRSVVIGLGSGTTMRHFIGYLGAALKEGKLKNIIGVPTSKEIEKLAGENSVPLSNLEDNPVIDIYFDGADELNVRTLYSLKGGGGALTKEKEVMNKSERVVILVDSTKLVEHTASKSPLYIEIEKPDSKLQDEIIKELNAIVPVNKASYRLTQEGKHILAVSISYQKLYKYTQSLPEIEEKINNKISGVRANGIFTRAPDVVIIGRKDKGADIIEVRKNKPIGNTHNLAEEISGIAIGRFTFVQIAENPTDEIKIDEKIDKIKQEIDGLFDQDKNIIFTGPFLYKIFTLAMLDSMFNNSDSFKGATVVDFGAGDGALSLVALGLGAKQVVLVEKNKDELEKAKIFLEARGWRKDTDFFIMPMDFAQVEFIEKIKNFKPTVALINIGPWAEYGNSNEMAVSIASVLPEVSLILNGGYHFELTSDNQASLEFTYLQHHLGTAGFTVSDYFYPPHPIHVLTAKRLLLGKEHKLGFQNKATITMVAKALKYLIIDKKAKERAIRKKIKELNKLFPNGEIEIEEKIQTGIFKCSGKEYKYAVFHFKKEDKTINVLFLEDHAALTPAELAELKIQDIEKYHLDCPGLEGVWFINSDAVGAKSTAEFEKLPSRDAFVAREALFNSLELTLHSLEGDYGNMTRSGLAFREFLSNKILSIDLADARSTQILDKTMRDVIDSLWQEIEKKFPKENRTPSAINSYIGRRIGPLYDEISQRILAQIASFDTERPDNWRRIESYIKGKIADANRDGVNIVAVVVYGSWPRDVAHSSSDVDCICILSERAATENSMSSFIWSLNYGAPHKFHMLFGDFIDKQTYPNFRRVIAGYSTRPAWKVIAANDSARLEIEAKLIATWHSLLAEDAQKLTALTILEKEIDRIHNENFKYMPTIPKKTILCHIIVDSILPEGQRTMLKTLEKNMRDESYSEKVASLTVNKPDKFIDQIRVLMARQRELYKDYTVNFDVACPNTDLVTAILGSNLGIKALAFEPCKEADAAQVEGIILALRALNSGNIETLREAFKTLAEKELPWELSGISDIDELIKRITFILPAAKVIDYSRIRRLNEIIRKNIEAAA